MYNDTQGVFMNVRTKRLRMIASVLHAHVIANQNQLIEVLQQQGVEVTQATLSRDLRDLRAEKKIMPDGAVKYVIPANPVVEQRVLGINSELSKQNMLSVDFCGQFAVVKTRPGYANAVAYDIDSRGASYILGTLAGDDTILVIPRETTTREELHDFLYGVDA